MLRTAPSPLSPMNRPLSLLLVYVLLASLGVPMPANRVSAAAMKPLAPLSLMSAGQTPLPGRGQRTGELLVRFRSDRSEGERTAAVERRGGHRGRHLRGNSAVEQIDLSAGQDLTTLAAQLSADPTVEFVEPNFLITPAQTMPNDTRLAEQWALKNTGQSGGQTGADIRAASAWQVTTGAPATVIAVLDSGIDFTHPDLINNQWNNARERANGRDDDHDGFVDDIYGWDWTTDSNQVADQNGHGTSVAGIIAAQGNNGTGISGVMWRASLMNLRVLDSAGTGDVADAVEAIDYAVAHGARVINMSWGTDGESLALKDAISRAGAHGVLVVCSAGNSGSNVDGTPYYPASFNLPNLIAVAATDQFDQLASWSNWGAQSVSVAAPGVNILTTKLGGDYSTISGTSAAAPLVSGSAGLVATLRPDLGAVDLRTAVMNGARRVEGLNGRVAAAGIANAAGALAAAQAMAYGQPGGGGSGGNGGGNNGGNNGGGNNGGNGQGGGSHPSVPPGPPGHGSGGHGPGGSFTGTPPAPSHAAPPGFINQDQERKQQMPAPHTPTFIHADTVLPICDATCGGDAPPGAGGSDPYFGTARMRPENKTGNIAHALSGQTTENLGSRNFSWGAPLVSLAGRAGLDLNIALYYNSLVWTKQDGSIQFDADHGFPGPGFHLGFPTLQPRYLNGDDGVNAYALVTSAGGRVEMQQSSPANTYESTDGSYTQLVENPNGSRTVRTSDGTQLKFVYFQALDEYRCTEIKDRNGNFITIAYGAINGNTTLGRPTTVTDTLGRVITFEYDGLNYLSAIWQTWNGVRHNWVTFNYDAVTLQPNFPGLNVLATTGTAIPVLSSVGFADGSSYEFGYENGWGMVNRINHRGPGRLIAYTTYNLPTPSTAQTDCPRFTERHDWAQFWNGDTDALSASGEEAVTTFSQAADNSWSKVIMPDGTMHKEFFATVGWQQGQSVGSEDWDKDETVPGAARKKWTTTGYSLPIGNLGFEAPALGAGGYQYSPAGGSWTFANGAGVSNNGSGFTSGNPAALEGAQVAFVQGVGTMAQAVSGFQSGARYVVRFLAAQRGNYGGHNQDFQVLLDNAPLGTFHPIGVGYTELTTPSFTTTAGTHTLQFVGLNTTGGDNTAFIDNVQVTAAGSAPVPLELNIYDAEGNRRRTSIAYTNFSLSSGGSCSLPSDVYEYDANATTVLRQTHTDYNLNPAYLNNRIIGLVSWRYVYDGNGNMVAMNGYLYDQDWSGYLQATAQTPTQHDETNYNSNVLLGRANLSWTGRFDVTDPGNWNKVVAHSIGYNQTGQPIFSYDSMGHRINTDYTDSFAAGGSRNTFAYPTTITDADNFSSTSQYNYDTGALTRTQDPKGAVITVSYDAAGRREQVTNLFNNAYTHWAYDIDNGHTRTYSTVTSAPGDPLTAEAYTNTIVDGLGQVRLFVANHPGSAGGYLAVQNVYDNMGRVVRKSNPTEITGGGVPAGADAGAGYQYTAQAYDWKGRPTLTTYPKINQSDPGGSTTEITYGGCGCAGGEVTTVRDERGRYKKYMKDVLGRLAHVAELNWGDANASAYADTYYYYNARDQLLNSNQAGQWRGFAYDGYGRLSYRNTPEQGETIYGYNADDTLASVADERGAAQTFSYNNRRLVTGITYGVPVGVGATPNVTFGYDEAGNRTSMNNGVQLTEYHYNMGSQLDWEQVYFPGLGPTWYRLDYQYNLAGEATRVTNPWGVQVAYNYDAVGRVSGVAGTDGNGQPTYGGVTSYAQSISYRAFGGLNGMIYGNSHPELGAGHERALGLSYDNRQRLTEWHAGYVMGWHYDYNNFAENTGRVTFARSSTDASLNRSYDYDQAGRLVEAHTGNEADAHVAGQPFPAQPTGAYSHSYRYDVWGNMTTRVGWGGYDGTYVNWAQTYTNNRLDWVQYDAAGHMTNDGGQYTYDAAGRQTNATYPPDWQGYTLQQAYDGDGQRAKKVDNGVPTYYLRSSVLGGQVVCELNGGGGWQRGFVYLGGQLLALQGYSSVYWVAADPVTKSQRITDSNGNLTTAIDVDPWGGETNRSSNQAFQPHRYTTYERDGNGSDQAGARTYHGFWMRFDQPDQYDGSMQLTDPQSLNRYSYVQNDPVNFTDPSGLFRERDPELPPSLFSYYVLPAWAGHVIPDWGLLLGGSEDGGGGGGEPQEPSPTPTPKPVKGPCDVKPGDNLFGQFFSLPNLALFKSVANQLNTDVSFVMTHSAWESHYGDTHARELHNLFGLTHGGGKNLGLDSYQQGADIYVNALKGTAAVGAKTFDDYISGLKQAGYNSATPGYYDKVKSMMNDVMRHYRECLGTM